MNEEESLGQEQAPPRLDLVTPNEVRSELDAIQASHSSVVKNLVTLAVTLAIFVALGVVAVSVSGVAIIVVVLFVHEMGHFVGMKAFRYRDVKMFFVPMLGAAVSGRGGDPSGAKKAIVSLLGPLPGIFVGACCGVAYFVTRQEVLLELARVFAFLNVFNLLPFHPLDGARFLERCLFSRNVVIEVVFKLLTGLALVGVALLLKAPILGFFALVVLLSLGATYRSATIAREVRATVPPAQCDPDHVPDQALAEITRILNEKFPKQQRKAKTFATVTNDVWERVCNRPPGLGATIGLLFVYAFCLVLGIAVIFAIEIGVGIQNGTL
jgi:Zn-dependent protease